MPVRTSRGNHEIQLFDAREHLPEAFHFPDTVEIVLAEKGGSWETHKFRLECRTTLKKPLHKSVRASAGVVGCISRYEEADYQTVAVGRLQEILDAIGVKTAVTLTA